MKYLRTIQEFNDYKDITRGIYEAEHDGEVKLIARKGSTLYVLSHFLDKPELNEMWNDVSMDFLNQLGGIK